MDSSFDKKVDVSKLTTSAKSSELPPKLQIKEAIKEDISYEYCAKHAAEIYNSSLVALQFENIRKNFDKKYTYDEMMNWVDSGGYWDW
mgnify:CR=1 FL=1